MDDATKNNVNINDWAASSPNSEHQKIFQEKVEKQLSQKIPHESFKETPFQRETRLWRYKENIAKLLLLLQLIFLLFASYVRRFHITNTQDGRILLFMFVVVIVVSLLIDNILSYSEDFWSHEFDQLFELISQIFAKLQGKMSLDQIKSKISEVIEKIKNGSLWGVKGAKDLIDQIIEGVQGLLGGFFIGAILAILYALYTISALYANDLVSILVETFLLFNSLYFL